jgi:hypothetical protein
MENITHFGGVYVSDERIAVLETKVETISDSVRDINSSVAGIKKDGHSTAIALTEISMTLKKFGEISEDFNAIKARVSKLETYAYKALGVLSTLGFLWVLLGDKIKTILLG